MKLKCKSYLFGLLALLCFLPSVAFAQGIRVEGQVKDETGEPMIGVLPSVSQSASLEFSYIGYVTQRLKVSRKMAVSMKPDAQNLEEVVVIAYGQQKKVTITGAVSAVNGDELLKAPVASVANALQGKLPGMSVVQPSGMPGADEPVIRVRGTGSLNSAEPLVLVDGVERSFGQLDPNEIQDISILKDASATAVFGVRGANGVILVTTKRGTPGKASVTVSASAAVQQISQFVDFADS